MSGLLTLVSGLLSSVSGLLSFVSGLLSFVRKPTPDPSQREGRLERTCTPLP